MIQYGGFNPCDTSNPNFIINQITNKLKELEDPSDTGSNTEEFRNKIIITFAECYDILLKLYSNNEYYTQNIKRGKREPYISNKPIRKYHLNYTALLFLNFLTEFELFILTYKSFNNTKQSIKYNTTSHPFNNGLLNVWEHIDQKYIVNKTRVYKDTLKIDLDDNKDYASCLEQFCSELNKCFNIFCKKLIKLITKNINNQYVVNTTRVKGPYKLNKIKNLFMYKKNRHIYENWRELILLDIINNNYYNYYDDNYIKLPPLTWENEFLSQINNIIFDTIIKCLNMINEVSYYNADTHGFFSWMYRDFVKSSIRVGELNETLQAAVEIAQTKSHTTSCITYTLLEHYVLYGIHFKENSIQCGLQSVIHGPMHQYWNIINSNLYNKLSLNENRINPTKWQYNGISHWYTRILNDMKSVKSFILTEITPHDLRKATTGYNTYKSFSISTDKWNYLRALVYFNFDSMYNYILKNTRRELGHLDGSILLDTISKTVLEIEKIVKKYEIEQNNNPLFSISLHENSNLYNDVYTLEFSTGALSDNNELAKKNNDELAKKNNENIVLLVTRLEKKFVIPTHEATSHKDYLKSLYANVIIEPDETVSLKQIQDNSLDPTDVKITPPKKASVEKIQDDVLIPVDTKEIFKDSMTKFITNYFYQTEKITFNFFKLINDLYRSSLSEYIKQKKLPPGSIHFLFKGGNILRLIMNSYINDLPGDTKKQFTDILRKNFKKSDADFQINIKNLTETQHTSGSGLYTEAEMDVIHKEVTTLAYLVLYRIRNIILFNLSDYIDYYKLDDIEKRKLLNKLLNKLNKIQKTNLTTPYNDPNFKFVNIHYDNISAATDEDLLLNYPNNKLDLKDMYGIQAGKTGRYDYSISKKDTSISLTQMPYLFKYNETDVGNDILERKADCIIYSNNLNTNFYITVNTTLQGFFLVRMKISIIVDYILNNTINKISVPGEYIDVSIPHWTTTSKYFIDTSLMCYNTDIYNNDTDTVSKFSFLGLSFDSIIADLHYMLFIQYEYPWDNKKYEIRITRLFIFYYVDLCKIIITIKHQMDIINTIFTYFTNLISGIDTTMTLHTTFSNIKFNKELDQYKNLKIIKFLNEDICGSLHTKLITDGNMYNKYKMMLIIINNVLTLFQKAIKSNEKYKDPKTALITPSNKLQSISTTAYNKYIKYKTKYLNAKNNV